MKFQHFFHKHKLSPLKLVRNPEVQCLGCMDIVVGSTYCCLVCFEFVMYKSCAYLPTQIQRDIFHPHPLTINLVDLFVCNACRRLTQSIIGYRCMCCELKLDFKCVVAILNDGNEIVKCDEETHQGTTILHFCHPHQLTRCIYSSPTSQLEKLLWETKKLFCVACNLELSENGLLIYAYVYLPCRIFIHE
ncbi:hypothetical protein V6N11_017143 [Hibiscus sabdariffa]|uniref:DC1 domain-containing protein n=1 Tax=Hibiscus sabdariffa TaxID=183260 RepID=A0ABR2TXE8_9ROSI